MMNFFVKFNSNYNLLNFYFFDLKYIFFGYFLLRITITIIFDIIQILYNI